MIFCRSWGCRVSRRTLDELLFVPEQDHNADALARAENQYVIDQGRRFLRRFNMTNYTVLAELPTLGQPTYQTFCSADLDLVASYILRTKGRWGNPHFAILVDGAYVFDDTDLVAKGVWLNYPGHEVVKEIERLIKCKL